MKLGIFINQSFYNHKGQLSTDLSFIGFIASFSESFSEIRIFAPALCVSEKGEQGVYCCDDPVILCELPYYDNVKDLVKKSYRILPGTVSVLKRELPEVDVLWIVGPHPLGLLAGHYAKKAGVPSFLHIRGNILNDVAVRYQNSIIGKAYARYMHFGNRFLSKRMPTLTVGSELFGLYREKAKKISWISPSLITEADIETTRELIAEEHYKQRERMKLLFVGRVEPEKGLTYLFEALRVLNQDAEIVWELVVVGGAQRGSEDKEAEIKDKAEKMGLNRFIEWKGYVPYGEELKEIYRDADIFILPSLAEGIPKVIYEALAFGLPIVSTNVGGISDVIQHDENGILIAPGASGEIVSAVTVLSEDIEMAERLVVNGLRVAENYTIEASRRKIMDIFADGEEYRGAGGAGIE